MWVQVFVILTLILDMLLVKEDLVMHSVSRNHWYIDDWFENQATDGVMVEYKIHSRTDQPHSKEK